MIRITAIVYNIINFVLKLAMCRGSITHNSSTKPPFARLSGLET
jgi:hypothetical protein